MRSRRSITGLLLVARASAALYGVKIVSTFPEKGCKGLEKDTQPEYLCLSRSEPLFGLRYSRSGGSKENPHVRGSAEPTHVEYLPPSCEPSHAPAGPSCTPSCWSCRPRICTPSSCTPCTHAPEACRRWPAAVPASPSGSGCGRLDIHHIDSPCWRTPHRYGQWVHLATREFAA